MLIIEGEMGLTVLLSGPGAHLGCVVQCTCQPHFSERAKAQEANET